MSCSVKVAVRIRPLVPHEISKGCREILETVSENNQIVIKSVEKAFTFNYVLGAESAQEELYNKCVQPLLNNLFEGLNVTIFAYGQTGSGKTHSMGTAYTGGENMGVIPRAVHEIFDKIRDLFSVDFAVTVSFTELYREVLYDLLANKPKEQSVLELREDVTKGVYIPNVTEVPVESANEVLEVLIKGSTGRATGATNMNAQSSRSHSIFTINIAMQHKSDKNQNKTAKLHLVDLAGSERPKKTGAQGTTFKEGVDINKGLFVLGNVISALGDEKLQNGFIPYRDSNLTRLLKDSLGGNSITLMIACVSPADYNLEETMSTLRYADRARKIKNKPVVNQDPKAAEINQLKKQIKQLQLQIVEQGGPAISASEINRLKIENEELALKINELRHQLSTALFDKTGLHEKILILQNANDNLNKKLATLKEQYNTTFSNISIGIENNDVQCIKENLNKMQEIQDHFKDIHNDQIKTETEIRTHEETFTVLLQSNRNSSGEVPKELQEKQECHTTRQIVLNSELQEISKQLLLKEQLAKQLQTNTRYMVDEQGMLDTAKKIENLEREKEELMQQLKNVKTQEASSKIAEQRRKRVQELEEQLKELKKKITEQSRLIKLKEKDEQKIKQLHNEITSMKSMKIKLLKQMREESDRFRSWKHQAERELARIKEQDRKKQTEMAKMKLTYEKQKNVLKRKFEEAAALNKRLQSTFMKRKQAQEMRFNGKVEKIVAWLKDDFEVFLNLVEAETALSELLEDRATLYHQLDELKKNPETAEGPEVKSLEEDIDLRSVQIQDLQQKLLDSDEENKAKTRFDTVQTMVEAKYALKALYEQAAEAHKEKLHVKREMSELQENQKELLERVESSAQAIKAQEDEYMEQLANQQKTYEEKVSILLRQLRGIKNEDEDTDSELTNRCQILNERLEQQEKQNEEQQKIISELKKRLEDIEKTSMQAVTPLVKKKKEAVPKIKVSTDTADDQVEENDLDDDVLEGSFEDDNEKDPDWRKTPLGKRILAEKKLKLIRSSQMPNELGGSKRSSEGGCTCKTKCNSSRCGCRKLTRGCGSSCKCSDSVCENRNFNEVSSTEDSSQSICSVNSLDGDNETAFKRPRVDEENIPTRRRKLKNKLLFLD
ncbi:kinesin-like protein 3A [Rhynchophorus ferrugineus]|uniref:Kinesin motor domain-containing protein n=1 Tax=Rhynchophorus ferrugineus TaxID=354439 RepID=A0A834HPR0_RHYFE|nr:hypothetical protein GWI33_021381 [Rhynchophorus ferrugineus]